ncbi:MAG: mechanosensitive ion channel protein MscS, partial [Burkholderiales bacterium]|nr:mechanosensitive ion channel protein MscS [Burkholderiales bacterium]
TATVVATSYVECWRLDSASFEAIITARPELADTISTILAQRLAENQSHLPEHERPTTPQQSELLERIKHFFRLN